MIATRTYVEREKYVNVLRDRWSDHLTFGWWWALRWGTARLIYELLNPVVQCSVNWQTALVAEIKTKA